MLKCLFFIVRYKFYEKITSIGAIIGETMKEFI